jgi:hypothetical protein
VGLGDEVLTSGGEAAQEWKRLLVTVEDVSVIVGNLFS